MCQREKESSVYSPVASIKYGPELQGGKCHCFTVPSQSLPKLCLLNNIFCLHLVVTNLIIWLFYQPNCNFLLPTENKAVYFHTAHCCSLWLPRRPVCSAHLRVVSGQSHLLAVVLAPFLPNKGNAYHKTGVFGVSTLNEKQQHLQENWRTVHASLFTLLFIVVVVVLVLVALQLWSSPAMSLENKLSWVNISTFIAALLSWISIKFCMLHTEG